MLPNTSNNDILCKFVVFEGFSIDADNMKADVRVAPQFISKPIPDDEIMLLF